MARHWLVTCYNHKYLHTEDWNNNCSKIYGDPTWSHTGSSSHALDRRSSHYCQPLGCSVAGIEGDGKWFGWVSVNVALCGHSWQKVKVVPVTWRSHDGGNNNVLKFSTKEKLSRKMLALSYYYMCAHATISLSRAQTTQQHTFKIHPTMQVHFDTKIQVVPPPHGSFNQWGFFFHQSHRKSATRIPAWYSIDFPSLPTASDITKCHKQMSFKCHCVFDPACKANNLVNTKWPSMFTKLKLNVYPLCLPSWNWMCIPNKFGLNLKPTSSKLSTCQRLKLFYLGIPNTISKPGVLERLWPPHKCDHVNFWRWIGAESKRFQPDSNLH